MLDGHPRQSGGNYMSVDLASDSVWQAVADYIRAQLGVTLGLKACEQGNYLNLPPSDDLGDILPMVLVDVTGAPGNVLPGFAGHELRHHVTIHYLVAISDTEISDRKTRQGATRSPTSSRRCRLTGRAPCLDTAVRSSSGAGFRCASCRPSRNLSYPLVMARLSST